MPIIHIEQVLCNALCVRAGKLHFSISHGSEGSALLVLSLYYNLPCIIKNSTDNDNNRLPIDRIINFDRKATLDLWNDFKARSRCIEVLYQPNKEQDQKILTKVYFDFDPLVILIKVIICMSFELLGIFSMKFVKRIKKL